MRSKLIFLLFLIVPAFVLMTSLDTIQRRGFNWFGGDYDPTYCYLLNSVNNANLKPAGHIDHPGTTAQVYGAVVLRGYHLIDRSETADLRMAVLKDPERHIFVLTYAFLGLNCLFLIFSGIIAFRATGKPWLAILLQTAPFFSVMALYNGLTHATQESMLFLSVMMMLSLVSWQFFPGQQKRSTQNILLFAFVTGFGMASKITFFPLVILPLILLPGLRNKLRYIFASIGAFVILTFPIWTQYGRMLGWFMGLFTHTGRYGSGSVGLIDKAAYWGNIRSLLFSDALFFSIVALSLLLLLLTIVLPFLHKKLHDSFEIKVLFSVTLAELAGLLLVAKMPDAHYMLPYTGLLVLNIFCILLLLWTFSNRTIKVVVLPALIAVIIVFVSFSGIQAKNMLYSPVANKEYMNTVELMATYDPSYARIYCLPSASIAGSLFFGDVYARREYLNDLQLLYPNSFFYNAPDHHLMTWDGETISFEDVISTFGSKLLMMNMLRGYPLTADNFAYLRQQGLELKDVFKGQYQTIYEASVVTDSVSSATELLCDAEEMTSDHRYYISADGHQFETGASQSDEKAHSGKYSARLTAANPFAMTIKLDSLSPGNKLEVSAWRWGGNNEGCLVAAGPDFYIQKSMPLKNGPGEWNKIFFSFVFPENMSGKQLKIYTWNPGQSVVYFDDLRVVIKHK